MAKKVHFATEEDIPNANPSEVSKLNFGGNLYMQLHEKGYKYFVFRICLNGNDISHSIGKYPDMTLAQAQEIAEKYRSEVANTRKENDDAAFIAKLRKPKRERKGGNYSSSNGMEEAREFIRMHPKSEKNADKYPSLRTMEDAGQFIRNLIDHNNGLPDEIRLAIWLQLLIPARASELLCAPWKDFNSQLAQWTIKQGRMNRSDSRLVTTHVAYLSQHAITALNELHNLTGNSDYLFPTLSEMPKPIRDKEIARAIQKIWPNYLVEPDGFRFLFRAMAIKYSYFAPELIEAMMAHNVGNASDYNYRTYFLQMRALAEWWGSELSTRTRHLGSPQFQAKNIWDLGEPPIMPNTA